MLLLMLQYRNAADCPTADAGIFPLVGCLEAMRPVAKLLGHLFVFNSH